MSINIIHILLELEVKLQKFLQNRWSQFLFSGTTPENKENNLY